MNINDLQKKACDDPAAEAQLFELLTARFRSIARRNIWDGAEAEEAVQDALSAVLAKHKTTAYDMSFSAWAYGVLKKVIARHNIEIIDRREKSAELKDDDEAYASFIPNPDLEIRILDCFRKLSRKNRMYARIINYSYQGYQSPEICRRIGLTRTNFYSILCRSRALLMQCIKKGSL